MLGGAPTPPVVSRQPPSAGQTPVKLTLTITRRCPFPPFTFLPSPPFSAPSSLSSLSSLAPKFQDPNFDLLLGAMFGDIQEFEAQMLDPSAEVLQRAMAIGHRIAQVGSGWVASVVIW